MSELCLKEGLTSFQFLTTGDLGQATIGRAQLNQVKGNLLDGSMTNLYLRMKEGNQISHYPLIGVRSQSEFAIGDNQATWQGEVADVRYLVTFTLGMDNTWFWDVQLEGDGQKVDVILGQDIGLATVDSLLANEAYISQYVDYKVFDGNHGKVVCARQNQDQGGFFPYLQLGSLTGAAHFSTDGYQFFGKSFKMTNQPSVLSAEALADEIYQYEMGYIALQSQEITLSGQAHVNFYGLAAENHADKISELEYQEQVIAIYETIRFSETATSAIEQTKRAAEAFQVINGLPLEAAEIANLYPDRKLEEVTEDGLLSFFGENDEHIVLQEKEMQVERSHGHIIMSGKKVDAREEVLTSTSYMYGAFQAQVVLGNTSMNKFISNVRNPLNFFKTTGQRIYLKNQGIYQLLGMPSLYEVGFNYSKWVYKFADDQLEVVVYSMTESSEIELTVTSQKQQSYDILVTQEVICDDVQTANKPELTNGLNHVIARPNTQSLAFAKYPQLAYQLTWSASGQAIDNQVWFTQAADSQLVDLNVVTIEFKDVKGLSMTVLGSLTGELVTAKQDFTEAKADYQAYIKQLNNQFKLSSSVSQKAIEVERFNTVINWYTHNMLVHYLVPHGLEQFGGAAWGTRDVCQGPVEFFLATQNYEVVKNIILILFSHQFEETGNWPQWFMFDEFAEITAGESHGDIIVWPLKVVADYLHTTNDFSILDEKIPYMNYQTKIFTKETYTLMEHVEREISYIEDNFLPNTYLSCYGDGDWDDTLQPFDSRLKEDMASTWTVALTYQTLRNFSQAIAEKLPERAACLAKLAENVGADYRQYMLKDGILPGFVLHENDTFDYIVHPHDTKTGIDYRLLPMTRSMISELFTEEEVARHLQVINDNLLFPDGVHLMSQPANYDGGVSTYFKRAEQAANFGREVGLQYVHAHIRYSEAMAKLGHAEEMWQALSVINPILIQDYVPNAEIRQSNAYFSSSDGKFNTRYEAAAGFKELQTGQRAVKGGWRIYSSGPGIYINQLISNLLGIRVENQQLVIDPVIAADLGTVTFEFAFLGQPLTIVYGQGEASSLTINGQKVDTASLKRTANRYRQGGVIISQEDLAGYQKPGQKTRIEYSK